MQHTSVAVPHTTNTRTEVHRALQPCQRAAAEYAADALTSCDARVGVPHSEVAVGDCAHVLQCERLVAGRKLVCEFVGLSVALKAAVARHPLRRNGRSRRARISRNKMVPRLPRPQD